jgi:glucosyl-3-phosphoglycerate synthase
MEGRPSSPNVADWFHRRTWSVDDLDPDELAALKAAADLSVSVVLPALNEERTVAGVVSACAELGGELVDEIVVLDGGSSDDTARLAAEAGARVHRDEAVLPEAGAPSGKGDALWRSLAVTSGDLVCFLDADVENAHPDFVVGLLAPLLHDADVQLVKAFYERPVRVAGEDQASGGGRVTELCARPVLNLFWPELAGLVQPLSGEYAGRRRLFEALPFFTGYGVELGLLVDTLRHAGADAIAQVDVHERVHANQPLEALGRMAFAILQVAVRRLVDDGRASGLTDLPTTLTQFARTDEPTALQSHEVRIHERPPLRTVR